MTKRVAWLISAIVVALLVIWLVRGVISNVDNQFNEVASPAQYKLEAPAAAPPEAAPASSQRTGSSSPAPAPTPPAPEPGGSTAGTPGKK